MKAGEQLASSKAISGLYMAIRNLLVACNGLAASDAALSGARLMQRHYDAHLTGLFAHGGSSLSQHMKPWMPPKVKEALREVEQRSATEIEANFRAACKDVPAGKLHWIESADPANRAVAAHARLFDITVLGVHEQAREYGQARLELYPDRVAFDSGRPVIIFPTDFTGSIFDGRAVVAWDGGRTAARALADAMQILATLREVEIVSIGRLPMERTLPGMDVRRVLERHGINVTLTELARSRRAISEVLVDHCKATGASLLVMGAYEHSPLREDLIGGVTHDIAAHTPVPVLMCH